MYIQTFLIMIYVRGGSTGRHASYACARSGVVSIYYIGELDKWLNEELASRPHGG